MGWFMDGRSYPGLLHDGLHLRLLGGHGGSLLTGVGPRAEAELGREGAQNQSIHSGIVTDIFKLTFNIFNLPVRITTVS